jgi:hypothetical protein
LITKYEFSSIGEQSGILHAVITCDLELEDTYCLYFYWDLDGVCQVDKFFKSYESGSCIAVSDITGGEWQASFEYSEDSERMNKPVNPPEWSTEDQKAISALIQASTEILSVEETDEDGSYRLIKREFYQSKDSYTVYEGPYEWANQEFGDETICSDGFDDEWIKDISTIMEVI